MLFFMKKMINIRESYYKYEMLKIVAVFNPTHPRQISLISCIRSRSPNLT